MGRDQENSSATRRISRKTFVTETQFEVLYKGKHSAKLFGDPTQHQIALGEPTTLGRFCRGDFNTFLPGHHLLEDVDETKVTLQVEHNKGGNVLSADSAFDKFGMLRGELGDSSKKQDASLSTTTADQLLLMMQRMQGGGATAAVDVPEPDAPADGAETREAGVPEDEDSSDDEPATVHVSLFNRLKTGGTMKPQRPAAAAKSSADTGGVHAKKPQSSADGAREAAAPSRRGDLTPQAPSARQAVVNLADDGRTRRIVSTMMAEMDGHRAAYSVAISFKHILDPTCVSAKTAPYMQAMKNKNKAVADLLAKVKSVARRIEQSTSNSNEELQKILSVARDMVLALESLRKLSTLLSRPDPVAADVNECIISIPSGCRLRAEHFHSGTFVESRVVYAPCAGQLPRCC